MRINQENYRETESKKYFSLKIMEVLTQILQIIFSQITESYYFWPNQNDELVF